MIKEEMLNKEMLNLKQHHDQWDDVLKHNKKVIAKKALLKQYFDPIAKEKGYKNLEDAIKKKLLEYDSNIFEVYLGSEKILDNKPRSFKKDYEAWDLFYLVETEGSRYNSHLSEVLKSPLPDKLKVYALAEEVEYEERVEFDSAADPKTSPFKLTQSSLQGQLFVNNKLSESSSTFRTADTVTHSFSDSKTHGVNAGVSASLELEFNLGVKKSKGKIEASLNYNQGRTKTDTDTETHQTINQGSSKVSPCSAIKTENFEYLYRAEGQFSMPVEIRGLITLTYFNRNDFTFSTKYLSLDGLLKDALGTNKFKMTRDTIHTKTTAKTLVKDVSKDNLDKLGECRENLNKIAACEMNLQECVDIKSDVKDCKLMLDHCDQDFVYGREKITTTLKPTTTTEITTTLKPTTTTEITTTLKPKKLQNLLMKV